MSNPYEVEHNIKDKPAAKSRRPDMSTFFSKLSHIQTDPSTHSNPNATPTPVDIAAAAQLIQDQYRTILSSDPSAQTTSLLTALLSSLDSTIDAPPTEIQGVPQSYLDSLERVPKKELKEGDSCPICAERFLDDEYPLVVELPCHKTHRFDLECVGPWLRLNGTCPLDRKELNKKKEVVKEKKKDMGEDEEEYDDLYA
ncbi:hypothetical protein B0O99DRAFT_608082 [Bisporella sp. PMI_857]|nr:hypothetical protein B0O99DRAFT_608082 [Bisporella sp. PMI_857]